jgi:hypothetical protein
MAYVIGSDGKRYQKRVYSGTCLCGCACSSHHCMVIARQDVVDLIKETVFPGACLSLGGNEDEHLGWDHCSGYVDRDEPDESIKGSWRGYVIETLSVDGSQEEFDVEGGHEESDNQGSPKRRRTNRRHPRDE